MKKVISFFAMLVLLVGISANSFTVVKAASNVTVWFYNSGGYSTVYGYTYFIDKSGNKTEALGGWPGKPASHSGTSKWWSITVPGATPFNIIWNDNAGKQTAGCNISDSAKVYTTVKADSKYTSKSAAEKTISGTSSSGSNTPAKKSKTRVWFYNSKGWNIVDAYCYGGATANALGAWPGKPTVKSSADNWYYIDVPLVPPFHIMFNKGGDGTKASDKEDTYFANATSIYTNVSGNAYKTKTAAMAGLPKPKPAKTSTPTSEPSPTPDTATPNSNGDTTPDTATTGTPADPQTAIVSSSPDSTSVTPQTTSSANSENGPSMSAVIVISVCSAAVLIAAILALLIVYLRKNTNKMQ